MGFDNCFRCVPPSSWLHLLPTLPHSGTQAQLGPPLSGHFLQDSELSQLVSENTLLANSQQSRTCPPPQGIWLWTTLKILSHVKR